MKFNNLSLYLLLLLTTVVIVSFSCKSTKSSMAEIHSLYITLQKDQTSKYLDTNYAEYNPSEISRSNRTLNQYRVSFTCTQNEFNTLQKSLIEDSNVIAINNNTTNSTDVQSGKNDQHAKTKSIRDKN